MRQNKAKAIRPKEMEFLQSELLEEISNALSGIENPIIMVLESQLYIEHLLDRFIISELPNGSALIKKGNLTFKQKIIVSESFGIIDKQVIDCLIKINRLRNDFSHKYGHSISNKDIEPLGKAIGKHYRDIKARSNQCLAYELKAIIHYVVTCVATNTQLSEFKPKP